ncbi:MAG: hypothetical protein AMJ45_02290 [Syntrophobacter sp. DG_60]|nr:MAG: hypothetical protein AMJ45_02290 [Syntrophobacter sp. DG_60]
MTKKARPFFHNNDDQSSLSSFFTLYILNKKFIILTPMIEVSHVSKRFGPRLALEDVSFLCRERG